MNNLGAFYGTLSAFENTKQNLMMVIKICEQVLEIDTLETSPLDYAGTNDNLGHAYLDLFYAEKNPELLLKSKKCYENCLKVYDKVEHSGLYENIKRQIKIIEQLL